MNAVRLKISLQRLENLKPHEEHIERRVEDITRSLETTGILRRPLIADEKTGVVIDGTHRLEALKRLGAVSAPVVLIDYISEEEVRVMGWVRLYRPAGSSALDKILESILNIPGASLEKRSRVLLVMIEGRGGDPYRWVAMLERDKAFRSLVERIEYLPSPGSSRLRRGVGVALIMRPLSKKEVIEAGVLGRPYPPKSTRHLTILKRLEIRFRVRRLLRAAGEDKIPGLMEGLARTLDLSLEASKAYKPAPFKS